jgi:hypothetical protein
MILELPLDLIRYMLSKLAINEWISIAYTNKRLYVIVRDMRKWKEGERSCWNELAFKEAVASDSISLIKWCTSTLQIVDLSTTSKSIIRQMIPNERSWPKTLKAALTKQKCTTLWVLSKEVVTDSGAGDGVGLATLIRKAAFAMDEPILLQAAFNIIAQLGLHSGGNDVFLDCVKGAKMTLLKYLKRAKKIHVNWLDCALTAAAHTGKIDVLEFIHPLCEGLYGLRALFGAVQEGHTNAINWLAEREDKVKPIDWRFLVNVARGYKKVRMMPPWILKRAQDIEDKENYKAMEEVIIM